MVNDLKYYDGSVQQIARIPDDLKALYATSFELETRWIVEAAARRQKWIDQAQSLNIYIANANGKKLDVTYRMAWFSGLKDNVLPASSRRDAGRKINHQQIEPECGLRNSGCAGGRTCCCTQGMQSGRSRLRSLPVIKTI